MDNSLVKVDLKKQKKINLIIVVVFSLIFFCTIWFTHDIGFEVNDDIQMMNLLSGKYNGTPTLHAVFMLFPITLILQILYSICSSINWYAILFVLCEALFYMIAMYKIIENVKDIKLKIIVMLISSALIEKFFFAFLNLITFTEISTFIMLCVLILFLFYQNKNSEKILILLGIILAFTIRRDACIMMLPFFLPIGLYKLSINKENFKKYFILAIEIIAILSVTLISNYIIDYFTGWKEYNQYNVIRSKLYDYYMENIKKLPKEEKSKLFEEAGIDNRDFLIMDLYYIRNRRKDARKNRKFSKCV